jgi:hypothetical protein
MATVISCWLKYDHTFFEYKFLRDICIHLCEMTNLYSFQNIIVFPKKYNSKISEFLKEKIKQL